MIRQFIILIACLLPLGGCGIFDTRVSVSQVHSLPPTGNGRTIAVQPAEGLETVSSFAGHAEQLRLALSNHGYKPVAEVERADLVATLAYRNHGCTSSNRSVPTYSSYYNGKQWVQIQTGSRLVVESACTLSATLRIYEGKDFRSHDLTRPLYIGIATSLLPTSNIDAITPTLIRALFVDFPGISGETRRESISDSTP